MIKCCIFDLDGTLLDTIDTITYYINKTLTAHGIEGITREECFSFVGNGAKKLMTRALASRGVEDEPLRDALLAEYKASYDAEPAYLTHPYDGIPELLSHLRAAGVRLAVLSNKQDESTRECVRCFFGDMFECVFGGREGVPLKPAPEGAFAILDVLSADPSECAFIGDSEVDALTARNFGAAVSVSVLWGFRTKEQLLSAGAENFASHPEEIVNILGLR